MNSKRSNERHSIAAYINCKDCTELVATCVSHLLWADEVILADASISSDIETFARTLPARVKHFRTKTDDLFLRMQELFPYIESEYILGVDTDEILNEDLANEIQAALKIPCPYSGFYIPSKSYNYGAFWGDGETFLRVVRKNEVRLPLDSGAHENWTVKGPTLYLSHSYDHLNNPKLGMTAVKHFRYAGISAARMEASDLEFLRLDHLGLLPILWHGVVILARLNIRFLRTLFRSRQYGFAALCLAYSEIFRVIADDVTPTEEYRMRIGHTERGNRGYY